MTAASDPSSLALMVSPSAEKGGTISAYIEASNAPVTVAELQAPDTALISQPHRQIVGRGTFKKKITWTVEHVQAGVAAIVEITVSAGSLVQTGLCRITG